MVFHLDRVVSVTELRNALRCPRVLALGRSARRAVTFPLGSSCLGAAFHRIVDRFARTVDSPPRGFSSLPEAVPDDRVKAELARWILGFLIDELEANSHYATMPAEVDDLAEALREYAGYLAERVVAFGGKPAETICSVVRSGEHDVEATFEEVGLVLRGRIDALLGTRGSELQVVEYKLTDEANEPLDVAQVALYRELLARAQGLDTHPVILRFGPALSVCSVDIQAADTLWREELLPLLGRIGGWLDSPGSAPATQRLDLCAACPVSRNCREQYPDHFPVRDDPPMAASRPRPGVDGGLQHAADEPPLAETGKDDEGEREARRLQTRILEELRKDGITAVSHEPTVGPTVYVIPVARPRGTVVHLDRAASDVIHRLATTDHVELEYARDGGRRSFVARRPHPRPVWLGPLLGARRAWLSERPGRFVLGQTPEGEILTGDLADSATPHLLIGGQAGSGKSYLLRALVSSLIHFHDPAAMRVTLLDPKRVTFNARSFQSALLMHLDGPVLYGIEDAIPCFERYVAVMEERYSLFADAQVSDLHEYNDVMPRERRLPRHVIVMDEFQDLTADRKAAQKLCFTVARLGAKARAAGVHLILATQRPDRETVPSVLKSNLGGKVALRVASAVNSRVILDRAGAEKLLGKGDLIADLGKGLVRAQAAVVRV
jgi:S-DNA-T family DNA segregation ATPase FtsK/SpoIIIE